MPDQVGQDRKNVLPEMGAEEQADSLDEEEVAFVIEIAEVIEKGRKDKLPALRNVPKKKLLEETAKVDKVLSKFKTHSITKTNELFYAGAFVVTNKLGLKIDKVTEVEIKRGIFQGDSLSPLVFVLALIPLSLILRKAKAAYEFSESKEKINHLLFMDDLKLYSRSEKGLDSLVQTVRVFSEDIGMEFGIEKCAMLVMERGKIVKSVGIELPDGKVIKSLQEGESYKYLGILEADRFLEEKMKLNVSKEYIRRLRKVLKSKLNSGNLVRGVNTWAVSLLRYSAAFVSWRKSELEAIDRKTRKLFTIYGALHPKSDVDRLYIPRKEGGRGLISIKDCVELTIRGLEVYVHGCEERLIQAAREDKIDGLEAASVLKRSNTEKRLKDWKEKVLHRQYLRQTKEVRSDQC